MIRALTILCWALFAAVALVPLLSLAVQVDPGELASVLQARTWMLLGRTVLYGASVAGSSLVLGLVFGFLVARTDLPLARYLRPLSLVSLLVPPMLLAMVWTALLDMRGGPAAILVSTLSLFPLVAIFSARAFERIDRRIEDAAHTAGGTWAVLRVDLALVMPAALAGAGLVFVFTIHDFSVPDYVSWVGPKFSVFADQVFASWRAHSEQGSSLATGKAAATAWPLIVLGLLALGPALFARRFSGASVGGTFRQARTIALGRWRVPAFVFAAGLVACSALIPILRLGYEAAGGARGLSTDTLRRSFAQALELARGDLAGSLMYAFLAASLASVMALVLGHSLARSRRSAWLALLLLLPLCVPAILFGIGAIASFNRPGLEGFYDGGAVVVALYLGRFAVFAILIERAAVAQIDARLERAAELAGASATTRLARIVLPLSLPALAGGWMLVFCFCMRELDAAILLPAANHTAVFRIFNAVHFGRDAFVSALALMVVFSILVPGMLWSLLVRRRLELVP